MALTAGQPRVPGFVVSILDTLWAGPTATTDAPANLQEAMRELCAHDFSVAQLDTYRC
jgi:hypothetical protein